VASSNIVERPSAGFEPVETADASVLILGSLPGRRSIDATQYYAHPRNAFWPIMAALLDFDETQSYRHRLDDLQEAGIALWDVLASSVRPGSLDSAIEMPSARYNDFSQFFKLHPALRLVCFNGKTAEKLFSRWQRLNNDSPAGMQYLSLPSTSPAHAAMTVDQKLDRWRAISPHLHNAVAVEKFTDAKHDVQRD